MAGATIRTQADVRILGGQILDLILDAVEAGVEDAAKLGVKHAKRLAPVRKISYEERPAQRRDLSRAEIRASVRATRGFSGLRTTTRRAKQYLEAPEIVADRTGVRFGLKNPDERSFISGKGEGELRRGLRPGGAIYSFTRQETVKQQVRNSRGNIVTVKNIIRRPTHTLGGRLRGEIDYVGVGDAPRVRFDIVSPTPYARFVEFPTSRTAAQPYLRPTLEYLKGPFPEKVLRRVERAASKLGGSRRF